MMMMMDDALIRTYLHRAKTAAPSRRDRGGGAEAEIFRPGFEPHLQRLHTSICARKSDDMATEWKAEDFPCTL